MTFVACLFLSIGMALAQSRVSGKVTSAEDGHPVVGNRWSLFVFGGSMCDKD